MDTLELEPQISEHKPGYSANLRDRVLALLPLAHSTLRMVIDAAPRQIDAAIDALEAA